MSLFLLISLFSVACNDNSIIDDDGDFLVDQPLGHDYSSTISLDGYVSGFTMPDIESNSIEKEVVALL